MTITRQRAETCLSDLILDRWIAGEIREGTELSAAVKAHAASCSSCAARLQRLEAAKATFPAELWVARARRPRRIVALGALSALAAALLLFLVRPPPPTERPKGGLALDVVVRHEDGRVEQLLPGSRVASGEAIRFRVSANDAGYLTIASLDSGPRVTLYYPDEGESLAIEAGRGQLLDGSITLDDTLGPERIVAMLCNRPLPRDVIQRSLEDALAAAGGHPANVDRIALDCAETAFVLEKTP